VKNFVCVYDFETDGSNPKKCEPVQIAACMINPITLEIVDNSEFCSWMRPQGIDEKDYFEKHCDTIRWHAKNYTENYDDLTQEDRDKADQGIYQTWLDAPEQKQVWDDFTNYLLIYNKNQSRRSRFTAPIRAGINIRRFDNVIADRLCERFGYITKEEEQKIFNPRDCIDIMEMAFYWFENLPEPKSYSMDELRKFFGMSGHGAHDALNDVRDEALVIQKFLRLHRRTSSKVKFKNAMA